MAAKVPVRHFSDLAVWRKAHELFLLIAADLQTLHEDRASRIIADQILRSSSAISALIAEGFNAPTTREYVRYLDTAKRSAHETENWLLKLRDLRLVNGQAGDRLERCAEIARMLNGLSQRLLAKRR